MSRLMQFVVALRQVPTEEQIGALLHRCNDATIEVHPATGQAWVAFDRDAPSFIDAVVTGVHDVQRVGLTAVSVLDDEDLVTLGVIAQRTGRSEDAVRQWSTGATGPGGFPAPAVPHPRRPGYNWSEVGPWLRVHIGHVPPDAEPMLRAVNLALELRAMANSVERMAAIRSLLSG
jgi:hypothetical protein